MLKSSDCTCIRSFRQRISNGGRRRAALTTLGYQLPLVCVRVFDIGGAAAQLLSALSHRTAAHEEEEEEDAGRAPAPFCSCLSEERQKKKEMLADVAF